MSGPRIAIGGIGHETNTFRHDPTGIDAFWIHRGVEIIDWIKGTRTYPAGMIDAIGNLSGEVVPTYFALANPSGVIERDTFETIRDELITEVRSGGRLDGVALFLHGAAIAEGTDDVEGDIIAALRDEVGADVPIVLTMDLHGNPSDALAGAVQAILPDHLYPHTDMYDRGWEAIEVLARTATGAISPVVHLEHLPMLLPPTPTTHGIGAQINQLCQDIEEDQGLIDCTVFHGFGFTDASRAGAHVVVTTDNDEQQARRAALTVAGWIWDRREAFLHPARSAEQAVAEALASRAGPVVINDSGDNPGGGGPGDGTHLLRAILAANPARAAFGFISDPQAVADAAAAGVGQEVDLRLGGHYDDLHGAPLELRCYVKAISDGRFRQRAMGAGLECDLGPTVRVQSGGVDVVVSTEPEQTLDESVFLLHGIDIREMELVGLKSAAHFRAGFADIATEIVEATTPGLTSTDLTSFPARTRTPRPIWPLDDEVHYEREPLSIAEGP